jgi:hypothetical protein
MLFFANPGTRRAAMNDRKRQCIPVDCSLSIKVSARNRGSPARA